MFFNMCQAIYTSYNKYINIVLKYVLQLTQLASDIGGILGIFIGISIISVFEFIQLVIEVAKVIYGKTHEDDDEEDKQMICGSSMDMALEDVTMLDLEDIERPSTSHRVYTPHSISDLDLVVEDLETTNSDLDEEVLPSTSCSIQYSGNETKTSVNVQSRPNYYRIK